MGDEHGGKVHNLILSADEDVIGTVPDVIGPCTMGESKPARGEGGAIGLSFEQ